MIVQIKHLAQCRGHGKCQEVLATFITTVIINKYDHNYDSCYSQCLPHPHKHEKLVQTHTHTQSNSLSLLPLIPISFELGNSRGSQKLKSFLQAVFLEGLEGKLLRRTPGVDRIGPSSGPVAERARTWALQTQIQILSSPLMSCVTLSKILFSLNLSFPCWKETSQPVDVEHRDWRQCFQSGTEYSTGQTFIKWRALL